MLGVQQCTKHIGLTKVATFQSRCEKQFSIFTRPQTIFTNLVYVKPFISSTSCCIDRLENIFMNVY